jgi:hypothetical protein
LPDTTIQEYRRRVVDGEIDPSEVNQIVRIEASPDDPAVMCVSCGERPAVHHMNRLCLDCFSSDLADLEALKASGIVVDVPVSKQWRKLTRAIYFHERRLRELYAELAKLPPPKTGPRSGILDRMASANQRDDVRGIL